MAISITVSTPGGVGHTTITSSTVALGAASAAGMAVVPQNGITSSNVQAALEELASFNFQQDSTPTGTSVTEGDTWYDTDDNEYKIYRETSAGVFQWVPIMVGSVDGDSDSIDAGAF
tara:strand:+ start:1016 stop:1366 length:351 start_codon:yes stop_codon:yes gene_type:complete